MKEKLSSMMSKTKTYYSYNKYKAPVLFTLIGLIFLTAFPGLHYEHWYRVNSKFNALAIFAIMLIALVQFVNAINISGKKSKTSEKVYLILFTVFNVALIGLALVYILPYFVQGFKAQYLKSILVISIGIGFMIIANIFGFIFLGYDTQRTLKDLVEEAKQN